MATEKKSIYPRKPYTLGTANGVTLGKRSKDKIIPVRHNTPGNIIVVHGVNDLGKSYAAVERGLCEGLSTRLDGELNPGDYRLPTAADKDKVIEDPDAVFYKRTITKETLSPVIPFYWGYREVDNQVQKKAKLSRGQILDRYGNRLDKDCSKGGGPFANATTTLPDMWNKGKWAVGGALDAAQQDATHPVLNCPGRMYMILAAQRLAALICMIRDYDEDETVSIVAHSQGCLISLLAQAFLLDPEIKKVQPNARPADTLILTHPPYSLVPVPISISLVDGGSGTDQAMEAYYSLIKRSQTVHARLSTLANIVGGVWSQKYCEPKLDELVDAAKHCGAVGKKWRPEEDRDNRGRVYLYFCPEDMTVALSNVQGIGWQGVPEYQKVAASSSSAETVIKPFAALGAGFRQRVFTAKKRPDPHTGEPVLIGPPNSPFLFALRQLGEDDQGHTEVSDSKLSKFIVRGHLSKQWRPKLSTNEQVERRQGIVEINGDELKVPVQASLLEGAVPDSKGRLGASESVDQIDAAIAITSATGLNIVWQVLTYPIPKSYVWDKHTISSPFRQCYDGLVIAASDLEVKVQDFLNKDKSVSASCEVLDVYVCVSEGFGWMLTSPPKILIRRYETPDEGRFRWQHQMVPRSFHGAIFGGQENHRTVTAYDVAIGGGKASSDPAFYDYLCAVADWRLQQKTAVKNLPGIRSWGTFFGKYLDYFAAEPLWRSGLLKGNSHYYSFGALPAKLPLLPAGLAGGIVCELMPSVTTRVIYE
jgi:hypothetical protein